MSASDFNALLGELYTENDSLKFSFDTLYNKYIRFHLPEATPLRKPPSIPAIGNQTNIFENGLQLGAIYFVVNGGNKSDWWFVVGYNKERLEVFYGEMKNDTITRQGMYIWMIRNIPYPPPNNIITDSSIIQTFMDYFVGGDGLCEIFIAYPLPTIARTLNFSKRGFMQ